MILPVSLSPWNNQNPFIPSLSRLIPPMATGDRRGSGGKIVGRRKLARAASPYARPQQPLESPRSSPAPLWLVSAARTLAAGAGKILSVFRSGDDSYSSSGYGACLYLSFGDERQTFVWPACAIMAICVDGGGWRTLLFSNLGRKWGKLCSFSW